MKTSDKTNKFVNRESEIKLNQGALGKWSFVNQKYQMIKNIDNLGKKEKFLSVKHFAKQKMAMIGLSILVLTILLSFIIPFFTQDPKTVDPLNKHAPMFSSGHIFGTDYLGRDIWARVWGGLQFSFKLAFMAVLVDLVVGYLMGVLMGYFPIVDAIGQFVIKIFINIPSIIILILLTLILSPSFWTIVLGITITGWIGMANQVRGWIIRAKTEDWVVASKTLGTHPAKIIFKKMTPHIMPIIIAQLIFTIPSALIGDLSLATLGLAIPNTTSLGSLLEAGRQYIIIFPMESVIPITISSIVLISIQFTGFGIQRAIGKAV